jgi:hypothetical protein
MNTKSKYRKLPPLVSYIFCFFLAVAIEFIVLFPLIFANLGMNHTANSMTSHSETVSNYLFFIFHLPTVLMAYGLDKLLPGPTFMMFSPLTQIIFWTSLFAYINYRRLLKSK